jgi:hypothetical protein
LKALRGEDEVGVGGDFCDHVDDDRRTDELLRLEIVDAPLASTPWKIPAAILW